MNLLPRQCCAARSLLDWTQAELAERSGVSRSTIKDFESARHELHRSTMVLLVRAFEAAGLELLGGDDTTPDGVGVRFRPRA